MINSTADSPDSNGSDSLSVLSGGSAAFILIALILGLLAQSRGSLVVEVRTATDNLWRISPLLCGFESLIMLFHLLMAPILSISQRQMSTAILKQRRATVTIQASETHGLILGSADEGGGEDGDQESNRDDFSIERPKLEIIIPIMLQFCKIVFIRGVPWTTAFAILLWSNWAVVEYMRCLVYFSDLSVSIWSPEFLQSCYAFCRPFFIPFQYMRRVSLDDLFARLSRRQSEINVNYRIWAMPLWAGQGILEISLFFGFLNHTMGVFEGILRSFILSASNTATVGFFYALLFNFTWAFDWPGGYLFAVIILICDFVLFYRFCTLSDWVVAPKWEWATPGSNANDPYAKIGAYVMIFILALGLLHAYTIYSYINYIREGTRRHFLNSCTTIAGLISLLIYYKFFYDSTGSYKPEFLDWLG
ncbi:hypothetical protein MMC06_003041 [Schaereria dolodes]|nr:hypothetical protein [Schaereria dolodes]